MTDKMIEMAERYRAALEEIVNPLAAMQKRTEAEGNRLSGMAYSIANSASYLQGIAREALRRGEVAMDLLPCPFCGDVTPEVSDNGAGLMFNVHCGNQYCRASGPWERCAADAASAWNTRAINERGGGNAE